MVREVVYQLLLPFTWLVNGGISELVGRRKEPQSKMLSMILESGADEAMGATSGFAEIPICQDVVWWHHHHLQVSASAFGVDQLRSLQLRVLEGLLCSKCWGQLFGCLLLLSLSPSPFPCPLSSLHIHII